MGAHERALIRQAMREADDLDSSTRIHRGFTGEQAWSDTLADALPGYRLLREIHRGGQGIVYQALHVATRRKVAIKVMREGPFAGPRDRARFEREMHILAQLDHAGIVTIHDSGEAAGNHYYVMDYVSGQPLHAHASRQSTELRPLIALFRDICEVVHAAHVQGIIHRDLKPGNIRIDADGRPHVLDFGLAKVAGGALTGGPTPEVMTATGQFVGSLPWASPEQVEGVTARIDMRTDVYSLGVILYHLLTGRFPYRVVGPMREVMEQIARVEPVRPRQLRSEIDDELETIVLKCLAKARERRYQTAGELARDLTRYLAGEPIEAKRDSGWYIVRKTLRRYRLPVVLGAGAVVALMVFAVTMYVLYDRATTARRQAVHTGTKLVEMAQLLDLFNPAKSVDRGTLDTFAAELDADPPADPALEAMARDKIGNIYRSWSRYPEAEHHLARALEIRRALHPEPHADLGETLHNLAFLYWDLRDFERAKGLFVEARDVRRAVFGAHSLEAAQSTNGMAASLVGLGDHAAAEALHRQVLTMRIELLGAEHEDVAASYNNLGATLLEQHRYAEAEAPLRLALDMMERRRTASHPRWLMTLHNLARCLEGLGQLDDAEGKYHQAVERKRVVMGNEDSSLAISLYALARVRLTLERYAEAEEASREALDIRRKIYPAGHVQTARALVMLAACLTPQQRYEESERMLIEGHATLSTRPADDEYLREALQRLVELYDAWDKPDRAALYREPESPAPEGSQP
jgi:tetratricopeptide (TPR) repeat protein